MLPIRDIDQALLKLESTGLILQGQYKSTEELEWCERRLLARIHRLTVGRLCKEIEPVTSAQFIQWLLSWQHLTPGTQLSGEQGLLEVVRQLQGFEIPAKAWERHIFPKRIKEYDRDMLDRLCLSGAIRWGRLSTHPATAPSSDPDAVPRRVTPTSVAPITFFVREEADWLPPHNRFANEAELACLSHVAKSIYDYLQQKGASFFTDITRGVPHLKAEIETALWELVAAGVITADGFDNLRALIDSRRRLDKRRRRVQTRFSTGRWTLLHTNEPVDQAKQMEAICWMLLKRYGVVFRDLLAREKNIPRWREIVMTMRRLEDRGEIRCGRFVSGFLGEQFALPYAVDSLRAMKKREDIVEDVAVSAADPLNLVGIILPGERVSATSGKKVVLELATITE